MPTVAAAGTRDRLVTIERMADSVAPSGLPKETVASSFQVWAKRNDLTNSGWSRERMAGDSLSARLETEWTLPYRPDMDPEAVNVAKVFRLNYQGRIHDIVIAAIIGRREGILVTTTARTG